MEIRNAKESDLDECEKLLSTKEFEFAAGGFSKKDFLKGYIEDNYFLVLEDNNKIVGLAIGEQLKNKVAILWFLAIDKNQRGFGHGTALLKEFENKMKNKRNKWILLYGLEENPKTLNFYIKNKYNKGKSQTEFTKELYPNNS